MSAAFAANHLLLGVDNKLACKIFAEKLVPLVESH